MTTWVLTPCHQPRLDDLQESLKYLGHPAEHTVVVTTLPEPITVGSVDAEVLLSPEPGINISRWWNLGLEHIAKQESGPYEVLCMESDVRITQETVHVLRREMRDHHLAMTGADWHGVASEQVEICREPVTTTIGHRIPGVCMLVAGELGLRFDEQFRWWYADDDFVWQHRINGGTGLVRGQMIGHNGGTPLAGQLAQFADEDGVKFHTKWGARAFS
jgi:hypothetical protein